MKRKLHTFQESLKKHMKDPEFRKWYRFYCRVEKARVSLSKEGKRKLDVAIREVEEGKVKTFKNVDDLIKELHK